MGHGHRSNGSTYFSLFNNLSFNGQLSWMYFAISFIGTLLTQTAVQSAEVYRLLFRPWPYIGVMLTNTVATAALTILFVVYLNGGVLGFFIGNTTGSLVAAVVGWSAI